MGVTSRVLMQNNKPKLYLDSSKPINEHRISPLHCGYKHGINCVTDVTMLVIRVAKFYLQSNIIKEMKECPIMNCFLLNYCIVP